ERRRQRIGRILTAAGADGRTGVLLDALEIFLGHLAGAVRSDGLERADDGELLALPVTRFDRTGVDEDAGHVDARHRHHRPGQVLVAAAAAAEADRSQHRAVWRAGNALRDDPATAVVRHRRILSRIIAGF